MYLFFNKVLDFLSGQWGIIIAVASGLYTALRIKEHIEDKKILELQNEHMTNTMEAMNADKRYMQERQNEIRDLTINQLLDRMHQKGYTRPDT